MLDFVDRRFDLLLATTIIESGLDIPNANTIFIDEADRYGLADLHQLRGRVGRYKHRAYCYLLVDPNKNLSPSAARRLRAIEEFSDMGAGFAIAMRDLEIRGAGNILGTEQSGHIAAVGYELYCELLEQAVRRLKQLPPQDVDRGRRRPARRGLYSPVLRARHAAEDRPLPAAGADSTPAELADFRGELADRFGPPPPLVEQLLWLAELRIAAHRWRIKSIHLERPIRRVPLPLGAADPRIGGPKRGEAAGGRRPKRLSAAGRRHGIAGSDPPAGQIAVAAEVGRMPIIRPRRKGLYENLQQKREAPTGLSDNPLFLGTNTGEFSCNIG